MWKISLFLILIGATLCGCQLKSFLDEMQCSDCSQINQKCEIITSGWSCNYEFDAKLIKNTSLRLIVPHLRKCVPYDLGFAHNKAIFGFCCIWSPIIGCQKLMRKERIPGDDKCYQCSRSTWSSLMSTVTCPCGDWFFGDRLGGASSLKGTTFYGLLVSLFYGLVSINLVNSVTL